MVNASNENEWFHHYLVLTSLNTIAKWIWLRMEWLLLHQTMMRVLALGYVFHFLLTLLVCWFKWHLFTLWWALTRWIHLSWSVWIDLRAVFFMFERLRSVHSISHGQWRPLHSELQTMTSHSNRSSLTVQY